MRSQQEKPVGMPATQWTLVHLAGAGDEEALNKLLSRYRPALVAHLIRGKRLKRERAEDLLHDFVCDKILRKQIVSRARQHKGKFRTFLLTALDRYLISEFRKRQAGKRRHLDADVDPNDSRLNVPASAPVLAGDVEWAWLVIERALKVAKEECEAKGQAPFWIVFEDRVVNPVLQGCKPSPYEDLAKRLAFHSPVEVSNALVTAKRRFTRALLSVVSEYVEDQQEAGKEIHALCDILVKAGAW